ncbi:PEP-CTERM sorting domain-containing protein [Roseibacillus ishigakijimensis]|uniref:PEP-CTERM sorting domain-containing protein n=1 Tax=Roseibacillus ishigakijimensis TaxID=454146 RepID=A0A934RRA9_9BACT|nr:PEP-CTERM sorting domain-containing protein [Roseibacillus ishigakijimensis]MBK1835478.1 PEP-CTERM sorting domain-containing protein [Roseibacillus ishigakijimensis]
MKTRRINRLTVFQVGGRYLLCILLDESQQVFVSGTPALLLNYHFMKLNRSIFHFVSILGVAACGTLQGAVVVNAQGSGTEDSDPFPAAFTPVSSTDLINSDQASFLSISDVNTGGRPNTVGLLNDGIVGVGNDFEAQFNTGSITFNLDLAESPLGYTITNVNTYSAWNTQSGGRSDQEYTLTMILLNDSEVEIVSGTHYANTTTAPGENGEVNVWTEVLISDDDSGVLATGVKAVRFDFATGANAGGTATYNEFDIIGTAVPEPSTALLGVFGLLALSARKRR